jgi:hypothetical protein
MTQQQAENIVCLRGKTLPNTPDDKEPSIPPICRIEVNHPVAAADFTTDGKLSMKRVMTSDWPRTPCW